MRGIQDPCWLIERLCNSSLNIFEIGVIRQDRVAKILAFCQVEIQRVLMKESGNQYLGLMSLSLSAIKFISNLFIAECYKGVYREKMQGAEYNSYGFRVISFMKDKSNYKCLLVK